MVRIYLEALVADQMLIAELFRVPEPTVIVSIVHQTIFQTIYEFCVSVFSGHRRKS